MPQQFVNEDEQQAIHLKKIGIIFLFIRCYYNNGVDQKTEDVCDHSEYSGAGRDLMEGDDEDLGDTDDIDSEKSGDFGEVGILGMKKMGPIVRLRTTSVVALVSSWRQTQNLQVLGMTSVSIPSFGMAVISHGDIVELEDPSTPGKIIATRQCHAQVH